MLINEVEHYGLDMGRNKIDYDYDIYDLGVDIHRHPPSFNKKKIKKSILYL